MSASCCGFAVSRRSALRVVCSPPASAMTSSTSAGPAGAGAVGAAAVLGSTTKQASKTTEEKKKKTSTSSDHSTCSLDKDGRCVGMHCPRCGEACSQQGCFKCFPNAPTVTIPGSVENPFEVDEEPEPVIKKKGGYMLVGSQWHVYERPAHIHPTRASSKRTLEALHSPKSKSKAQKAADRLKDAIEIGGDSDTEIEVRNCSTRLH